MMLLQIESSPSGFDRHVFECSKCEIINTVMVAADPMKSDSVNRLAKV
jgi:hypothetical protein